MPIEKYYLVDAGYTNGPEFLAPFRSTRYHLKEWASSQQQPKTFKELYNLRHSRARNVVERTFGDHAQNGWKPHVYNAAIRNVREKCNVEITKDNIASRCKTFDKHYEVISKILSQSGFGWDWVNDKLLIDSDDVWNKYVEVSA